MQLLGTSPLVTFDRRYPAEYRFLSYFARMAEQMTEPFDETQHLGVTPFFFGARPAWGPIPFASEIVDVMALRRSLLRSMWSAWTEHAQLERMRDTPPDVNRITVRYEDLVSDLPSTADRIAAWLGVPLDAAAVERQRDRYRHHMTSPSVTESIGRYKRDLAAEEAVRIGDALGSLLALVDEDHG